MPASISHKNCQAAALGSFHDGFSHGCHSLIVSLNVQPFHQPMGASSKDMRTRVRILTEGAFAVRGLPQIGFLEAPGQLCIPEGSVSELEHISDSASFDLL